MARGRPMLLTKLVESLRAIVAVNRFVADEFFGLGGVIFGWNRLCEI